MSNVRKLGICGAVGLLVIAAYGAERPNLTGTWVLSSMKSKNMGFIAGLQATVRIRQTEDSLIIDESSAFMGQERRREVHYDLMGKPMQNEGSQGEKSETVSHWMGDKLVTVWTWEGVSPGTRLMRTETRYLAADGTMTVEAVRGGTPPVIMVFDKK